MNPNTMKEQIEASYAWVTRHKTPSEDNVMAATRDIFRARLDRVYKELTRPPRSEAEGALLTAIAGEIGNNCFDHNLGQWRDEMGCWFIWGIDGATAWIILADRGQGVLSSLGRVDPSIRTDQQALDAAFSRIISGRSPEKRGNGLKFVKRIVNGNSKRGLFFSSGKGRIVLGSLGPSAEANVPQPSSATAVFGTWALLLGE